jgi:hypothetical protein
MPDEQTGRPMRSAYKVLQQAAQHDPSKAKAAEDLQDQLERSIKLLPQHRGTVYR